MKYRIFACATALALLGPVLGAQTLDPIRYTLRFPAPHTHYVEVEAAIPTSGRPEVEVYMATWTPGSYLIREYERHVEAVTATAGIASVAAASTSSSRRTMPSDREYSECTRRCTKLGFTRLFHPK